MFFQAVQKALSKPGSETYRWGFYLYRTTYQDDELWNRYMAYIHMKARRCIQVDGPKDDRVSQQFRIYVIENSDLDGASIEEVRQRFISWRDHPNSEQSIIAPSSQSDVTLKSYPLYVDEQCLESLREHEQLVEGSAEEFDHQVLIKAMNAEPGWDEDDQENSDEDDEESDLDESASGAIHDEEEFCWENPAYRWMLVSGRDLVFWWCIMSLEDEWHRQYQLCSEPGNTKRPWIDGSVYDGPMYHYS